MANEEQLSILKQGVEVWGEWRRNNLGKKIDLLGADLSVLNLVRAEFGEANLEQADLSRSHLMDAYLRKAHLQGANLREAHLDDANLWGAGLSGADLWGAHLTDTNLCYANLRQADLSNANLRGTDFRGASLDGTKFSKAIAAFTILGNLDLRWAIGLAEVRHTAPSHISTDTLARSEGKIPEAFLRGCGLSDWEIEMAKLYDPALSNNNRDQILYKIHDLQAHQAIQISPLFISYSHGDTEFVNKIDRRLTKKGVRFWRDIHDLKAGRIEKQIDTAINQNRTVLLILSEHSLNSDWVEHEVRTARDVERKTGRDVLCPVALDESWKHSRWPKRLMEQIMEFNILDFSAWHDDSNFDVTFQKLLDGLELFYKG